MAKDKMGHKPDEMDTFRWRNREKREKKERITM